MKVNPQIVFTPKKRTQELTKGTWQRVRVQGRETARISCPVCGFQTTLNAEVIESNGSIERMLFCPEECGFASHVRLDKWGLITKAYALMTYIGTQKLLYFNEKTGLLTWKEDAEWSISDFLLE